MYYIKITTIPDIYNNQRLFMKITLLLIILTILSACSKSDNMSLDSELNKNSYAIGKKIGENLKSQEISVNIESLKSGIEDSFSGKSKLSDDEIKKTLINLNSKSNQDHDEEFDKNIEIGRAFLKENKLNKKVLEFKDGIQMITNKEGSGKQLTLDTLIKI
jgi:FKBP-type peptidyl-prolyl cis-trans isomerase